MEVVHQGNHQCPSLDHKCSHYLPSQRYTAGHKMKRRISHLDNSGFWVKRSKEVIQNIKEFVISLKSSMCFNYKWRFYIQNFQVGKLISRFSPSMKCHYCGPSHSVHLHHRGYIPEFHTSSLQNSQQSDYPQILLYTGHTWTIPMKREKSVWQWYIYVSPIMATLFDLRILVLT